MLLISATAQSLTLTGRIITPDQKPLEDVTISDGYKRVLSRRNGSFIINTRADSLSIYKMGYDKSVLSTANLPATIVLAVRPIALPPVRIIGSYENSSAPALDATTIFSGTDSKSTSVAEVLLQNSSISSSDVALTGEKQTLSLLGNLSRHTLVMLDGVVLNPAGEAFDFSSLALERIERIEIIKGNASLYGGGSSIGGVVNLYSKKAGTRRGLKAESEFGAGSFGLYKDRYLLEYRQQNHHISLGYTGYTADNDFPYQPRPWWNLSGELTRHNNRKTSDAWYASGGLDFPDLSLDYEANVETYTRALPGPVNFLPLYDAAKLTGAKQSHNIKLQYLKQRMSENLSAWYNTDKTEFKNLNSTNPVYPSQNKHQQRHSGIKSQTGFVYKQSRLDYSAEVSRQSFIYTDKLHTSNSVPEQNRLLKATALRGEQKFDFNWGDYTVGGGWRYDKAGDFDGFQSWRIEQTLNLQSRVNVKFGHTAGTAFALPSFYDLFWKGDTQSMGNPDLKPETSQGQSVWSNLEYGRLVLKAAWHQNYIADLIQWRQVYLFGTVWKPVNISAAVITGQELELSYEPMEGWLVSGSVTGVDALDKSKDSNGNPAPSFNKRLIYTPDWRYTGRIALNKFFAGGDLTVNYTGRQYSTADNQIAPLPDVFLCNASAYAKVHHKGISLKGTVQLNNILDKQYEVYVYVPQPGFNWSCGLTVSYER